MTPQGLNYYKKLIGVCKPQPWLVIVRCHLVKHCLGKESMFLDLIAFLFSDLEKKPLRGTR